MLPEWLLEELLRIPASTLFTFIIASSISLITTMLNRKFVDREKLSIWQREINRWEAERRRAQRTGDKKLMAKVKRQELYIAQLRWKTISQQMKTFAITFIPLLAIWQALIGFYGNDPVAYIPGLGGPIALPFIFWYMICSFFVSALLSKVLGISMSLTTENR